MRAEQAAFLNTVTLHDHVLEDGFSLHGALMSENLSLESCLAEGAVNFRACRVVGDFVAHRTIFTKGVSLQEFECGGIANLSNVQFKHEADFTASIFFDSFSVKHGDFGRSATFIEAQFQGDADFSSSHFHGRLSFNEVTFSNSISFRDFLVEQVAFFNGMTLPMDKPWSWHSAFYQATFKGTVDFAGVDKAALAAFDGVRFSTAARMDALPETQADEIFESAKRLAALAAEQDVPGIQQHHRSRQCAIDDRLRQLEHGCRVLKQSRLAIDQKFEALILHRFELRARRLQSDVPRLERWFSYVYDRLSDYGSSIDRPLYWLLGLMAIGMIIYSATLSSFSVETLLRPSIDVQKMLDAFNLTLANLFRPFGVWMTPNLPISWPVDQPGLALVVRLISTLQSLASITLLFLAGLAMRKRFQVA